MVIEVWDLLIVALHIFLYVIYTLRYTTIWTYIYIYIHIESMYLHIIYIYIHITHREIRARVQCSYIFILRLHPSFYPIHTKHPPSRPVVPSSHPAPPLSSAERYRAAAGWTQVSRDGSACSGSHWIQPTTPNSYPQLPPTMVKMLRVYQPTATFIADKSKISDLPLHLRLLTPTFPASEPLPSLRGISSTHLS